MKKPSITAKRRNDILLILVLLALSLFAFLLLTLNKKEGGYAAVLINGEETARYPLTEDVTVRLENPGLGFNVLVIKDGYAFIEEATCPDKLCVKQHKVKYNGETLVCLPNRITVEIVSEAEPETDFIS